MLTFEQIKSDKNGGLMLDLEGTKSGLAVGVETGNHANKVFNYIFNHIQSGTYSPGERLNEKLIARDLGISPVPVREAMERLIYQGWVERIPKKGVFLKKLTESHLDEIYELRLIYESYAIKKITPVLSADQIAQFQQLAEVLRPYDYKQQSEMPANAKATDIQFHALLIHYTNNSELEHVALPIILRCHFTFYIHFPQDSLLGKMIYSYLHDDSWGDNKLIAHDKIAAALAGRDADLAQELICKHLLFWNQAYQRIFTELKQFYKGKF